MTNPALVTRLRAWAHHRQRLTPPAATPLEALHSVVAVYSSHPTAPLTLAARTTSLDAGTFLALEQQRLAVRMPAMRGSIFLVPAESAARIFAATSEPIEKRARNLEYAGLTLNEYTALKPSLLEILAEPRTPEDLAAAVPSDARLTVAVRTMAREGLVLRVNARLRTDALRYVATEAWLGAPFAEHDPAASLAWLAREYVRAFGPATVQDFAWWAGVTAGRAKAAFAAMSTAEVAPGLLLFAEDIDAFAASGPLDPDHIVVLPKWDAYTMGYGPGRRQRLVDDEHVARAYSTAARGGQQGGATAGDGLPLILRGGRAVATWGHRFEGDLMRVVVSPFDEGLLTAADVEAAFQRAGNLLSATEVAVAFSPAGSSLKSRV